MVMRRLFSTNSLCCSSCRLDQDDRVAGNELRESQPPQAYPQKSWQGSWEAFWRAKRSAAASKQGGVVQKCNGPECCSREAVKRKKNMYSKCQNGQVVAAGAAQPSDISSRLSSMKIGPPPSSATKLLAFLILCRHTLFLLSLHACLSTYVPLHHNILPFRLEHRT